MNEPQRQGGTENTDLNAITSRIIGCAIEVHRTLGPGLLEAIYETALCIELDDAGIPYKRQMRLPVYYKGHLLGDYRVDLVVAEAVWSKSSVLTACIRSSKRSY
jgi:GxxExxY protein